MAALRDAYDQVSQDKEAVEGARASFAELLQVRKPASTPAACLFVDVASSEAST